MPGHSRGVVPLPGTAPQDSHACCGSDTARTCDPVQGQQEDAPVDPAKCCAVCYFNATLNTPPPVTLYIPYLGQLDEIAYRMCDALAPHQRLAPDLYRGRPPPTA
ncbi:MAG: hypothetical protein AAGA29_00060 [Planctomycetota bacterium]